MKKPIGQRLMIRAITIGIATCLLTIGCGKGRPDVAMVSAVQGKILLPNGRPLKGGRLVLRPTPELAGVAQPVSVEIQDDGTFDIQGQNTEGGLAAGEYKVFVSLSGNPRLKSLQRQVPEKYQNIGDDDTDLIINLKEKTEGIVLKMNTNKV
jgi:hypothetical protein